MQLVEGKAYYVVAHAYYHFIGVVVKVMPRSVVMRSVVQVHSCSRGWSRFFAEGFGEDVRWDSWPDGTELPIGSMPVAPWNHELPT